MIRYKDLLLIAHVNKHGCQGKLITLFNPQTFEEKTYTLATENIKETHVKDDYLYTLSCLTGIVHQFQFPDLQIKNIFQVTLNSILPTNVPSDTPNFENYSSVVHLFFKP